MGRQSAARAHPPVPEACYRIRASREAPAAVVREVARSIGRKDVETDTSVRLAFWDNEETGLQGSRAYVTDRNARQGVEDPPGSHRFPEPRWLGMIQRDMILFDHGLPPGP